MIFMADTPEVVPVGWLSGDLIDLLVPLVPILPYLAMFAIIFTGLFMKNYKMNAWIGVIANLGAWLISMLVFFVYISEFIAHGEFPIREINIFTWLEGSGWEINASFLVDGLSVIMITLVSTLALLIQLYGVAYMDGEEGTKSGRYNAEISLFVGSMLLLSLSANFMLFFIGWELMGVCSYLLIGFFTKKEEKDTTGNKVNKPASAAKKAFMITKIGDILLMAGFMLFFWQMLSVNGLHNPLNFLETKSAMAASAAPIMSETMQTLIALLIFGGAIGKSAQFPLHIWLPDAMEGPTTVSALIHSATMVKAGVFLVARTYYIFEGTQALLFVGVVGAFTAIFAASLAFVATDIKRVLAYSTISQLGYMFLGLGAVSLTAGMFHLISHSVFKCLLFLGAGSIIHAVHSNDMNDMGGLRPYLKRTHITFLIGGLGLAGIIPANGFFSKDAVIGMSLQAYMDSGDLLYLFMGLSGLITALLTGFYFFRMYFRVFSGEYNKTKKEEPAHEEKDHGLPHESPNLMTIPLMVLAGLVVVTGILSLEGFISNVLVTLGLLSFGEGDLITLFFGNVNLLNEHVLAEGLHYWTAHPTHIDLHSLLGWLWVVALGLALLGVFLAWQMYSPGRRLNGFRDSFVQSSITQGIDSLLVNKYYLDDLVLGLATFFREGVADGFLVLDNTTDYIIDGIGRKTADFCDYAVQADDSIIDGAVRYLSNSTFRLAGRIRKWQSGVIQSYVSSISFGILIIFIIVVVLTWS
jgi:NADH-quinone oxidoreductase subunit L